MNLYEQHETVIRAIRKLMSLGCSVISTTCACYYNRAQVQIADGKPLCDWLEKNGHPTKLNDDPKRRWLHGRAVFEDCDVVWLVLKPTCSD